MYNSFVDRLPLRATNSSQLSCVRALPPCRSQPCDSRRERETTEHGALALVSICEHQRATLVTSRTSQRFELWQIRKQDNYFATLIRGGDKHMWPHPTHMCDVISQTTVAAIRVSSAGFVPSTGPPRCVNLGACPCAPPLSMLPTSFAAAGYTQFLADRLACGGGLPTLGRCR